MTKDRWGVPVTLGEGRILHPGPLRWLRALGWMVVLFFIVAVPAYSLLGGVDLVLPKVGWAHVLASCVGAATCIGLYVLLVWGGEDRLPSELSAGAAPVGLATGLLIGLLMFSAVMGLMALLGLYDIVWKGPASAWQAVGDSISSGVMEETLSRAVMLRLIWRAFGRRFGPWIALALSAAAFGALHLGNPHSSQFAAVCIAVEAGVMLAAFYALTGRLWVSIGVHAGWNFTQGWIFGAAVSGTDFGPALMTSTARPGAVSWTTGGGFGPEASAPALFVGTLVGVVVIWLAWKAGRFSRTGPTPAQAEAVG